MLFSCFKLFVFTSSFTLFGLGKVISVIRNLDDGSEDGSYKISDINLNLEGSSVGRNSDEKMSALSAASNGELEKLQFLLARGADLNESNLFGESPLHAAAKNGHTDVIRFLCRERVNVNAVDETNKTALYWTAKLGYLESLQILLKSGADPYVKTTDNMTLMHVAARNGKKLIVRQLRHFKPLINAENSEKHTPLIFAVYWGYLDTVIELVNIGAEIRSEIVTESVKRGHIKILKYFLDKGKNVDTRDEENSTLLMLAISKAKYEMVEFLLFKSADVNAADVYGWTPLHWAADDGNVPIVKLLLDRGARINAQNIQGKTPYDFSKEETDEILFQKGAKLGSQL